MVPARQPSVSGATANWQEHIDGKPQYNPPIPPLAPAQFTGGLYLAEGGKVRPECTNYPASLQKRPRPATSDGRLERRAAPAPACSASCSGPRSARPREACDPATEQLREGMGAGATALGVPVPMPPLRQQ